MWSNTSSSWQAFELSLSLWKLVQENVSTEEQQEIKNILGESEVDQTLELHSEVETLLEIWQEYRSENYIVNDPLRSSLPEPPMVRDGLKNHILLLVESIRERSGDDSREPNCNLSVFNSEVVQYVIEDNERENSTNDLKRPMTACSSRDGRDTPMRMTPSSDGDFLSASSNVSDQVEAVKSQLNVFKIDQVVQELRSSLADETERLLNDIRFLQSCLEEEKDFRCQSSMMIRREPTLSELQQEKNRLQDTFDNSRSNAKLYKTDPKNLTNSPKRLQPLKSPLSPVRKPSPTLSSTRSPKISPNTLSESSAKLDSGRRTSVGSSSNIPGPSPPGSANNLRRTSNYSETGRTMRPSPPSSARPSPPSSAKPSVRRNYSSQRIRHQIKTNTVADT